MRLLGTAITLSLALTAVGFLTPVSAQTSASSTLFTQVEGISEYRLPNGLRVLLAPDASKPTTTVNITYLVGSRHENYGETGMAHLLEHLVFKGTPSRGNIMQELGKRGMRFNGTTFYDRTNYFETFPASEENLTWALEMEADRMVNSFIARKDLETEFSVVRNEMEMGQNNPRRTLWQYMAAAAYDWHNYGKSTIGARSDVENLKIENLQAFYRQYYQPDNAVLLVAGKFDSAKTLALVERVFGALPRPARSLGKTYTTDPVQQGPRELTLQRVGDTTLVGALYHTAAASHPDATAMAALAEIMADTPNGRLHKALVDTNKATSVAPWNFALAEPGYILFMVELGKDQPAAPVRQNLLEILENLRKSPITEAELKRAKASMQADIEKTLNDPQNLAVQLSESIASGDWRLFFLERDRIDALTVQAVQKVAENYFKESNRTFGQFIPTAAPERIALPEPVDVAALLQGYKGRAAVNEGENFDPSPANIEKRTLRTSLPNGMQMALTAKKTRGETVNGQIRLDFGDAATLQNQAMVAQMTASMLMRGAGTLNRAELAARLDELKAKIRVTGSGSTVTLSFDTVRKHLPAVLDLARDVLRAPTFPASEFATLTKEMTTQIESQRNDPQAMASQELSKALDTYPKGDVRAFLSFDERIALMQSIKLQDLQAFYQRFYGADHGKLALVGDLDPAQAQTQLSALFGNWKSASPYARLTRNAYAFAPSSKTLQAPDKPNAMFMAVLSIPLRDDDADYVALALGNKILGGGVNNRLVERLRQKEGISYYAGSQFSASSFEAVGEMTLVGIHAPQNLEKLQAGVREEVLRIVKDGVSAQELTDAKKGLLEESKISLAQDAALSATLAGQLHTGRTMAYTAARLEQIQNTSLEQVNAALRKYVDYSKLLHVHAGDFEGAKKKAP